MHKSLFMPQIILNFMLCVYGYMKHQWIFLFRLEPRPQDLLLCISKLSKIWKIRYPKLFWSQALWIRDASPVLISSFSYSCANNTTPKHFYLSTSQSTLVIYIILSGQRETQKYKSFPVLSHRSNSYCTHSSNCLVFKIIFSIVYVIVYVSLELWFSKWYEHPCFSIALSPVLIKWGYLDFFFLNDGGTFLQ